MTPLVIYNLRNIRTRRLTSLLTGLGMAFVVFVFSSVMMMAEGLERALVDTGSYDNVIVIRRAAQAEVQSTIPRNEASIVETLPWIEKDIDGRNLSERELVVLISLLKKDGSPSNVVIRGTGEKSLSIRRQVRLKEGRMPRPGSTEIAAGTSIKKGFQGLEPGSRLRFALREWTVVGIFDAGNTAFSSEIWADIDSLMQAFRRPVYSSLVFKLRDPEDFSFVKRAIETDPRLSLEAKREIDFYKEQSEVMARFLRILGSSFSIVFSLGAIIGAMITMYAQVSNRIQEIGTLRVLGFQKRDILMSFLLESVMLSLAGGIAGLIFSSFLQFYTVSTLNWQTFSELAFRFRLTPGIVLKSLVFSIIMGIAGGILPALRASRLNIVNALRTG